jgi:hypothetical protein
MYQYAPISIFITFSVKRVYLSDEGIRMVLTHAVFLLRSRRFLQCYVVVYFVNDLF